MRKVIESGLKVGDTVMYVGGRLPNNYGKRAKIVGIRDEYGFLLRYEDGTPGSATPEARKLVRAGSLDPVGLDDDHDARSTPRSTEHFAQVRSSRVGAPPSRHISDGKYPAMRSEVPYGENNARAVYLLPTRRDRLRGTF